MAKSNPLARFSPAVLELVGRFIHSGPTDEKIAQPCPHCGAILRSRTTLGDMPARTRDGRAIIGADVRGVSVCDQCLRLHAVLRDGTTRKLTLEETIEAQRDPRVAEVLRNLRGFVHAKRAAVAHREGGDA
jgi:hypothetical protein